jgi:hypothetical protein
MTAITITMIISGDRAEGCAAFAAIGRYRRMAALAGSAQGLDDFGDACGMRRIVTFPAFGDKAFNRSVGRCAREPEKTPSSEGGKPLGPAARVAPRGRQ